MNSCCFCENKPMKLIARGTKYDYYRCPKCNWYSTSVRSKEEQTEFDYEEYATFDYSANDEDISRFVSAAKRILDYKFKYMSIQPKSFLDVGCSDGVYVRAFNELTKSKEGSGIEISHRKVSRCRERGLNVFHIDEVPEMKVDFIFIRHTVEHVDDPFRFIMKFVPMLNEGGCLCIETPNSGDIKDMLIRRDNIKEDRYLRDLYPPTHVCGYTKKTFRKLFSFLESNYGFADMQISTYDSSNKKWCFDNGKRYTLPRRIIDSLGLGANLAVFLKGSTRL